MTDQHFSRTALSRGETASDKESLASTATRRNGTPVSTFRESVADSHPWPDSQDDRMICVCVNDFGSHAEINRAALRLAAMERVHAIGCTVAGETWRTWSRLLRRLDSDGVDIGLTLNLTESPLLAQSRSTLKTLVVASLTGRLDRRALRAEIRVQLDSFEQAIGHAPAFVDGHQHVHALPGVRRELLDELERRYGQFRPWVSSWRGLPGGRSTGHAGWFGDTLQSLIEKLTSRGLATIANERGYPQNRQLLAMQQFPGDLPPYQDLWSTRLRSCASADLMTCKPMMGSDHGDALVAARDAEFQWLSGAAFGELLSFLGISLWPMSQILAYHGTEP